MSVTIGKVTETSDSLEMLLSLKYPHTFLGITFGIGRKIGFLFTDLYMYQFRENTGVKDSQKMKEWITEFGNAKMVNEMLYGAAQAYCMKKKKEENFTKGKLFLAMSMTEESVLAKLINQLNKPIEKRNNPQILKR